MSQEAERNRKKGGPVMEEIVQVGTRKVKIREVLKGKILLFYL